MMWQIPLLQRYIFGEILRVFLFVVACLTILLIAVGVVQNATEQGLGPMQILEVLPYIVPSMLPFTIPAALLLTVCVVYGRLAGDQEVTAAKAAGICVMSLLWPAFFLGAVLSATALLLTDQVIPWAMHNIERRIVTAMEDVFLDRLRTDHQFRDVKRGIDVTVQGVEGRTLIRPIFRHRRSNGQVGTIQAETAEIRLDLLEQRAVLRLHNAFIDVPPRGAAYISGTCEESIEWQRSTDRPKARHMPIQSIRTQLDKTRRSNEILGERDAVLTAMALTTGDFDAFTTGRKETIIDIWSTVDEIQKLRTEIHSRFALACSCLFFTLVGGPFAILKAKSQFLTSFLYCFVPIVTVYYPLVLTLMVQSKIGRIDPEWSMWIGNGLLGVVSWLILRRVLRN